MNTVGIFAGRGDVILAMALSFAAGIVICWYLRNKYDQLKAWFNRKFRRGIPASR